MSWTSEPKISGALALGWMAIFWEIIVRGGRLIWEFL